ncbi:hypothetical protein KR044_011088, partial [Drosophila immigrans]
LMPFPVSANLGKQSPYVQIAVGAGGGFVSGYALFKIFKIVSFVTGSAILAIELGLQAGIITIHWEDMIKMFGLEQEPETAQRIPGRVPTQDPRFFDALANIKNTMLNSARLYCAFVGGFLIGMGVS